MPLLQSIWMKCYSFSHYIPLLLILSLFLPFALPFDPSNDIINMNYYGQWSSPTQPFNYFQELSGNIEILFANSMYSYTTPEVDIAEVTLLDPIYHSSRNIRFKIFLGKYQSNEQQWSGTQEIRFQLVNQGMKEEEQVCYVEFKIQMLYTNVRSQDQYKFVLNVNSVQDLYAPCQLNLTAQTKPYKNQEKVFYYCLFVAILSGVGIGSLLTFHKKYKEDPRLINKLSIKCVTLVLVQLWYLTIAHIWMLILQKNNYGFFMIPIVLVSIQSAITLRLLITIFKVKYQNSLTSKKWLVFIFTLVALFFGYGILMYIYPYDMLTVLLQSFIVILQIVKNSKHHKPVKISGYFFSGIFFLQYVLGLYYRGCPSNIYSIEPSFSFIFFWNGIYLIQSIVLLIQRSIGGRFFIPQCLYRYQTGYSLMKQIKRQDQCGICIGTFSINQQFALTKCGHSYHQMCLKQWLKVNEKCPMCRAAIEQVD